MLWVMLSYGIYLICLFTKLSQLLSFFPKQFGPFLLKFILDLEYHIAEVQALLDVK
jgi:hypothetical protein